MLKIRLQRTGRENVPTYRIVVAEKRDPVKGRFLEILGHYLPARKPAILEKNDERVQHWVAKGAIPSNTVARLFKKSGLKGMEKYIESYTKKKSKKGGDAPAEAAAAPVAAVATGDDKPTA